MSAKNWCLTLNNYTEDDYLNLWSFIKESCNYGIIGKEIGKEGTNHLQGYIQWVNRITLKWLKKLNSKIHWELSKGNPESNKKYCWKENNFIEIGTICIQGQRNDLKNALLDINNICNDQKDIYVKYHRGIDKLIFMEDEKRMNKFIENFECIVIWGKSGWGKTRFVFDTYGPHNVYKLNNYENLWFDGYNNQKILLIDDFYGAIKYSLLLNLLDKYHTNIPIKGGFKVSNWNKIYITSNEPWTNWYKNIDISALQRRITNTIWLPQS